MSEELKDIPISKYTTLSPKSVSEDTSYGEIVDLIENNKIRHLPVVDGKKIVGIISERNLKLPSQLKDKVTVKAADIMTPDPYFAQLETSLEEVVSTMAENRYGSAIIGNSEGELLGIFTTTDALKALVDAIRGEIP
jgi:acetoin utilization protein AcuB